ncbi:MAG TPA: MFS transporter [Puia sp.]|nr:MFS transporter [Puia sp.]
MVSQGKQTNILDKAGIPKQLAWGYLGILIFMMGDGVEQGWLSPYLIDRGLAIQQSASLFTIYGVTIAVSSWFSGVLTDAYGPRKTMLAGILLYIAGTAGFVGLGLPKVNFPVMLATYAVRGFGYPLFAYSFLVWIMYRSPQNKLSTAAGWFWFVFTGGLNVFGAYYSSWAIQRLGYLDTLWTSVFWVTLGAVFALGLNRDKFNGSPSQTSKLQELKKGFTIMREEPKVLLCGIVRVINTTSQFAFLVFMPIYMEKHKIGTSLWLQMWGTIFTSNIVFNLLFGFIGDSIGWRRTVLWFGCVGCAVSSLLFYYSPVFFADNYWAVLLSGCLWGALLAGFVPLSALTPSLVTSDKGAAMAVLNLGAGLAVFVGPAIVGLFIGAVGSAGVIWILSGLYVVGAILISFVSQPRTTIKPSSHTVYHEDFDNSTVQ